MGILKMMAELFRPRKRQEHLAEERRRHIGFDPDDRRRNSILCYSAHLEREKGQGPPLIPGGTRSYIYSRL